MNKQEVAALMTMISAVYPTALNSSNKDLTFDLYSKYLADFDSNVVRANFDEYVLTNKFPPTVADLTGGTKPKELKQAIPDVAETRQYLLEQQLALPAEPTNPEYIAQLREQAMKEIARGAAMNAARNPRKEWSPEDE